MLSARILVKSVAARILEKSCAKLQFKLPIGAVAEPSCFLFFI